MDYFKDKEANIEKARQKYTDNIKYFSHNIYRSIQESTIYTENTNFLCTSVNKYKPSNDVLIQLDDVDSVTAIFKYYQTVIPGERIAVLNFSSYKNPGGMFLKGSMAQEESLCHSSTLYNILEDFEVDFYEKNRKELNKALYKNRAIYTRDVVFSTQAYADALKAYNHALVLPCDVITCAAPNKGPGMRYHTITEEENLNALRERINFVIRIADANQVDTIILGAYGCGVFKQNPYEVAQLFKEELSTGVHYIRTAIFAIPDKNSKNYKAFEQVFGMNE